LLEGHRDGPEIVETIDIPLDEISFALREVRVEAMGLADLGSLVVTRLLVCLVVAMCGVELEEAKG
jgi:hypothetical protein